MKLHEVIVREKKQRAPLWVVGAVALAALYYGWTFWYCSGLYRSGALLSIQTFAANELGAAVTQHLLVNLPEMLTLLVCALVLKRRCPTLLGLSVPRGKGRYATAATAVVYAALLLAGLMRGAFPAHNILYGWCYYLIFVAFMEETIFRAVLPRMIAQSGLGDRWVWVLPAVLFAMMHTLVPLVTKGIGAGVQTLLFSTLGHAVVGSGFYALRRWSGTLWLPILLHAAMDFLALVI